MHARLMPADIQSDTDDEHGLSSIIILLPYSYAKKILQNFSHRICQLLVAPFHQLVSPPCHSLLNCCLLNLRIHSLTTYLQVLLLVNDIEKFVKLQIKSIEKMLKK